MKVIEQVCGVKSQKHMNAHTLSNMISTHTYAHAHRTLALNAHMHNAHTPFVSECP